jgi:Lipocalin-like domain
VERNGHHCVNGMAGLPQHEQDDVLAAHPDLYERSRGTMNTLSAYSGTYSVEGDTWTTNVEVASNPEWVGTKQVRNFMLSGERLIVLTPRRVMANWADKGMTRSTVAFERSK